MLVRDIYTEVKEIVGTCDDAVIFGALTRGIEMLSTEGLYDPLVGTVDLTVTSGYLIALPRDVKTPLRININGSPSFARSKFFEFTANTDGSVVGQEHGLQWSDKGYSPIQDETKLPGLLLYKSLNPDDDGKTAIIYGKDLEGREIKETLTATTSSQTPSTKQFFEVSRVVREETIGECYLLCRNMGGDEAIARYYGDESEPNYRVVKLSQTAAAVRVLYRKNVFRVTGLDDVISLNSGMAVILATKAARYYLQENFAAASLAMEEAAKIINKEQSTREEHIAISSDVLTASNLNINTRDSIIVADIYDDAAEIFGAIGRAKLFDEITNAIEVLSNKAQWDGLTGFVDIWKSDHSEEISAGDGKGSGLFVLPRYVDAIISLNFCGTPQMPRNKWYEFHLNGNGEHNTASCGKWDDAGEVVTVNRLPRDPESKQTIPVAIVAIPDNALDNDTRIEIFGEDENGREVKVVAPCKFGLADIDPTQPLLTRITRITKAASSHSITLRCANAEQTLLGYYYPDETEPKYRAIKVQSATRKRLRIGYRKRTLKISSLYDPIHLRSRMALRTMMRAMVFQKTDINAAATYEAVALNYLREEKAATNPNQTATLQFHSGSSPFHNRNVM